MAKKFAVNVAVHKTPAESVFFRVGDEVPDWALDKCGAHCFEAVEEDDVRFRDPQYEPDEDTTQYSTPNTLPPSVDAPVEADEDEDDEDSSLDELSKDELKDLAESRGLSVSGNKAELKERILADMAEEE